MSDDPDLPADVLQRIDCTALRMRLEAAADALVQEMFRLTERPYTKNVHARLAAVIGRVPGDVEEHHWQVIADAQYAYTMLCNVLHGRIAWMRISRTQLEMWTQAVDAFERFAIKLGFHRAQ